MYDRKMSDIFVYGLLKSEATLSNRVNRQRPHRRVELGRQLRQRGLSLAFLLRNLLQPRLLFAGFRDVPGDELFRLVRVLQRGDVFAQPLLIVADLGRFFIQRRDPRLFIPDLQLHLDQLLELGAHLGVDVIAGDEQLDVARGNVGELIRVHQRLILSYGQLGRPAGLEIDAETVEIDRLRGGLRRVVGKLPAFAVRVFDVYDPLLVGLIDDRVGFLLRLVIVSLEDSFLRAHQKDRLALALELRRHQRAQIESERDEALLFRFQPFNQRLTRICVAVNHRQRAAFERQLRSVLQPNAVHRAVFTRGFVVDRHALAVHFGLQDRNQRGTVTSHGDRLFNAVLEKLAYFAAGGRGFDAGFAADNGVAAASRRQL